MKFCCLFFAQEEEMKLNFLILIILAVSIGLSATMQSPDRIIVDGEVQNVSTSWGFPTLVELYYEENNIEPPYMKKNSYMSSGCWRGHTAVYEVRDSLILVREIHPLGDYPSVKPPYYNIVSDSHDILPDSSVVADWFTGMLRTYTWEKIKNGSQTKSGYFFYVKKGIVKESLNRKEMEKIRKKLKKGKKLKRKLAKKYKLMQMTGNFQDYYYRSSDEFVDTLYFNNKKGLFANSLSPIMELYDNDIDKWPYSWENTETFGSPVCNWTLEDSTLYITNLYLQYGANMYIPDQMELDLKELFEDRVKDNKVLADWMNGVYIFRFGKRGESLGFVEAYEFDTEEIGIFRFQNGRLIEEHYVSKDFKFREIPEDTKPELKKIIQDYFGCDNINNAE